MSRCVPRDNDHRGLGHGVRCRGIHTDALLPAGAGAQSPGLLCVVTLDGTLSTLSSCLALSGKSGTAQNGFRSLAAA